MVKNPVYFFFLILYFLPLFISAQYDKGEHLVFEDEFKKSFHSKPKLDVKFDNRFSFIRDGDVKTIGIKIGLNFRRKFKVGLGINDMLVPVPSTYTVANDTTFPV